LIYKKSVNNKFKLLNMLTPDIHDIISNRTCEDVKEIIIDYADINLDHFKKHFALEDYFNKEELVKPRRHLSFYHIYTFCEFIREIVLKEHSPMHIYFSRKDKHMEITTCSFNLESDDYSICTYGFVISEEEHDGITKVLWYLFPLLCMN